MMTRRTKSRKAQATLEFAVVFIIFVMLILGMTGIWRWSNDQFYARQTMYNSTRVWAGTARDYYLFPIWPVYVPPALTEDTVLVDSPFQVEED